MRAAKWERHIWFTYNEFGTTFYLLPTIFYNRPKILEFDGDCSFEIALAWLFWKISLERYWGSAYN